MSATAGRLGLSAAVLAVLIYLIFPVIVVVAISFSSGNFLVFPPPGFSLRWYESIASDPEWVSALWVTLKVGSLSALIAVLLGVPAAFALVRHVIPAKALLNALILCALVTPPIVTALSTYLFFVPLGLVNTVVGPRLRARGQRHALRGHQYLREPAQRRHQSRARRGDPWRPPAVGGAAHHAADHLAGHRHRCDFRVRSFRA